jgi:hypothetical protein
MKYTVNSQKEQGNGFGVPGTRPRRKMRSTQMFTTLFDALSSSLFQHYEISFFANYSD